MPANRTAIVAVLGSGREEHAERAAPLGRWLARHGVHLLTGGGPGVMTSVSRAFFETPGRDGLVLGIIPATDDPAVPPTGYPNVWVEVPIYTQLPARGVRGADLLSRNHINVLTADAIVALPGSAGTASEVHLARRYGRPVVAHLGNREQIPELPPDVPVHDAIEPVQAFVIDALGRSR